MTALVTRLSRLPRARRGSVAAFSLLIAGLAFSVSAPLMTADGVANSQPWIDAVASVKDELQPGDTVLVHPPWRDDVLDALKQADALPRGVRATVALALPHGQAPGRVLLVADPTSALPRARKKQLVGTQTRRVSGIDLSWLGAAPEQSADIDFTARVALARVHVEKADGTVIKCAWNDGRNRHLCPGLPSWMYVGADTKVIGGRSEACTWSHPITGGKVVIRWDGMPLPPKLELAHGLSDQAAGNPSGAPVTLTLRADGAQIARSVRTNARGMRKERVSVPDGATSLELEVTTPDDGARHYCWQLHGVTP